MLSAGFSTNCAPNFIRNIDNLITLGNTRTENKGLKCTIAYNNIESRFPNHVFYINFDLNNPVYKNVNDDEDFNRSYDLLLVFACYKRHR